jgi:hypothetical protein
MVNGSPTGRIVGNASRKKGTFMKDMKKHGIKMPRSLLKKGSSKN